MSDLEKAARMALEALELAQDNLRPHGDNCFLLDEGEYDRCFCGKDSLSDYLQSVVKKLDEALAEQPAQQKPVGYVYSVHGERIKNACIESDVANGAPVYTSPQSKPWVGLTDEQIVQLSLEWPAETNDWASHIDFARAIEAKLKEKNNGTR